MRFAPTAGRRVNACPLGSENVSGGCRPTCARNAPDTLTQEGCRDKAWRVQGEKFVAAVAGDTPDTVTQERCRGISGDKTENTIFVSAIRSGRES